MYCSYHKSFIVTVKNNFEIKIFKVLVFYGEPQWWVVGDTYPMGCKWGPSIVCGDDSFKDNPDTYNPKYKLVFIPYTKEIFVHI